MSHYFFFSSLSITYILIIERVFSLFASESFVFPNTNWSFADELFFFSIKLRSNISCNWSAAAAVDATFWWSSEIDQTTHMHHYYLTQLILILFIHMMYPPRCSIHLLLFFLYKFLSSIPFQIKEKKKGWLHCSNSIYQY